MSCPRVNSIGMFLFLLLFLCFKARTTGLKAEDLFYGGNNKVYASVYANTLEEVDGISTVPSVFGLTAYNGVYDFASEEGIRFLSDHNIDTVGFGTTLSTLLPTGEYSMTTSNLQEWFSSGSAYKRYERTGDFLTLKTRGIRKAGALPFLFIRNPLEGCTPYCQKENCWNEGGTPKSNSNNDQSMFQWWTTLITGYLSLALKADPNIDIVHIWNEPDSTFWKDGKNGSYYAKLFVSTSKLIKANWPNIRIGGPVSSSPSTDYLQTKKKSFMIWYSYMKPLIDTAAKMKLLDFIDFHAFDRSASPENLLNAIETTNAYALVKYNMFLPVAITESNIKSNSAEMSKQSYYINRTFPLMMSTFALLRHPGKVIHRLLFDYKGTSKCNDCQFRYNSGHPATPEATMYALLGKLANGSRLHVEIDGGQYMTSNCPCFITSSLGSQPVVGEAVIVDTNVTIALLNVCNCTITVRLMIIGTKNSAIKSSWAAIQDHNSVKEVTALPWSSSPQSLSLTPYSLYVSSYQFSTRYRNTPLQSFPFAIKNPLTFSKYEGKRGKRVPIKLSQVRQTMTAYPTKSKYIMLPIPSPVPCNYMFTLEYDTNHVMDYQPKQVIIRMGFLGKPGTINWSSTWKCSSNYAKKQAVSSRSWLQISSPGLYYEAALPCIPKVMSNGYVRLHFKASNQCQLMKNATSPLETDRSFGYLAFTSLIYISETTMY